MYSPKNSDARFLNLHPFSFLFSSLSFGCGSYFQLFAEGTKSLSFITPTHSRPEYSKKSNNITCESIVTTPQEPKNYCINPKTPKP